jgi:hypothetical protein
MVYARVTVNGVPEVTVPGNPLSPPPDQFRSTTGCATRMASAMTGPELFDFSTTLSVPLAVWTAPSVWKVAPSAVVPSGAFV